MPGLRVPIAHTRPNVEVEINTLWPALLTVVLAFAQLFSPSRVGIVLLWTP